MTQNEVGAYIMLLAHGWNTRGLDPTDPARLKLLAKGEVSEHVLRKFKLRNGRLCNQRQEKERHKQVVYRLRQAVNGKKGGRPQSKPKPNPSLSSGLSQTEPKKSSPSPSPTPVFIPAEGDALKWLANWRSNGADYTEAETKSAFLALSANGWMWGKNPVTDHRAALERQIQTDRKHQNYGKTNSANSRPNPRNAGVIRGPTNYATAKPRLQREREEAERKKLDAEVDAHADNPSSTQPGPDDAV